MYPELVAAESQRAKEKAHKREKSHEDEMGGLKEVSWPCAQPRTELLPSAPGAGVVGTNTGTISGFFITVGHSKGASRKRAAVKEFVRVMVEYASTFSPSSGAEYRYRFSPLSGTSMVGRTPQLVSNDVIKNIEC